MKAYIFDVDGVLADPQIKQVTEEQLFDELIYLLQKGEPVSLNTGRSLIWVEERIIDPLIKKLEDKSYLSYFIAIGEKGGSWLTFDKHGNKKHEVDRTITVPVALAREIKELIPKAFSQSMFFDTTKETMLSIEMNDGHAYDEFHQEQIKLNKTLSDILKKHALDDQFKIEPTISATDIENNYVGKALGSKRFLEFLNTHALQPEEFIAFGDSKQDIEMADELDRRGEKVTFVFVGDKSRLDGVKRTYHIAFVSGFSKGTLAYLTK